MYRGIGATPVEKGAGAKGLGQSRAGWVSGPAGVPGQLDGSAQARGTELALGKESSQLVVESSGGRGGKVCRAQR